MSNLAEMAHLFIWITCETTPLKFEFTKGVDINKVYQLVSRHVL